MIQPLTVPAHAPLELVHQLFTKLGARYVIVTNMDGMCECTILSVSRSCSRNETIDEGVIDKNLWLAFLADLEAKHSHSS
jgi:chloride channel 3/4/5